MQKQQKMLIFKSQMKKEEMFTQNFCICLIGWTRKTSCKFTIFIKKHVPLSTHMYLIEI